MGRRRGRRLARTRQVGPGRPPSGRPLAVAPAPDVVRRSGRADLGAPIWARRSWG